ncbi:hypothetical protein GGR51DRAFT_192836 [Nemania sp. FL0031]|nr:hypothetical protein GGR51DRAFT_192836 [Nemania sp. FL0031]
MEGLGAAASIIQLTTIAVSIIKSIHHVHYEAREGLTRAFQRTAELESLLTILHLIQSPQPSSPDSLQEPLLIVHGHLHELHKLLSKVRIRPSIPILLRLWTAPSIIKTENKIIEGLDSLERAKNSLILHLSATQRNTLDQILEKMNEQETKLVYGFKDATLEGSPWSSIYNPSSRAEEITSPTEEVTGYTLAPRQQRHIMALRMERISPAAHLADASQHDPEPEEETPANSSYENVGRSSAGAEWNISGCIIKPPAGSKECDIGDEILNAPNNFQPSKWNIGGKSEVTANKIGNKISYAIQPPSSPTSTRLTSKGGKNRRKQRSTSQM